MGYFKPGARSVDGPELLRRILKFKEVDANGCWIWTGARWKSTGYAGLWVHGKFLKVTRLLMWMQGNEIEGLEACHRCNVKLCINPDHLYMATHRQNVHDAERDGIARHRYGENHPRAKLTHDDALDILWRLEHGEKMADLARNYGVDISTLSHLKRGVNWKYLRDGDPKTAG
jgi:hypothetical protein